MEAETELSEDDRGEKTSRRWLEHLEVFLVDVMERTCDLADGFRARWKAVVPRDDVQKAKELAPGPQGGGRR